MERHTPPRSVDGGSPSLAETTEGAHRKPFVTPRLAFVTPRLTAHGDLENVTKGFFGSFSP